MSRGTPAPAPPPGVPGPIGTSRPRIRFSGGFTFAERPDLEAPDARIIWHADLDPGTLQVSALPTLPTDPDGIAAAQLAPWLTVVADAQGEHAVLSDGWRHIRLDIAEGSLTNGAVVLHYRLKGLASTETRIVPLRRFLDLCRRGRFSVSLYPPDRRVERWLAALRVHDAVAAGASQREIASALFGETWAGTVDDRSGDSLRSRVRRLVRDARNLARGGYRLLMRGRI